MAKQGKGDYGSSAMLALRTTPFEPAVYAALRVVSGLLFACHGVQKIIGWLSTKAPPAFGSQLWFGGLIELVGGVLIAVGLFTRSAAFLCSGTMAVAYIQFHWKLALGDWQWLPLVNKGELAALYCFVFLFIWTHGPGAASLDRLRTKKLASRRSETCRSADLQEMLGLFPAARALGFLRWP